MYDLRCSQVLHNLFSTDEILWFAATNAEDFLFCALAMLVYCLQLV